MARFVDITKGFHDIYINTDHIKKNSVRERDRSAY